MHDLLIENTRLCDGLGNPIRHADIAVRGGTIVDIGRALGAARETVDAEDRVLAPGIIDSHTHYDAQITWDPLVRPSPELGVTTVIIGNCGFTIAPCRPADRDLTMRNLVRVEGMSLDAMRTGIAWEFESFPQYLDMIERRGTALNVAAFVGHSSVRTFVMGEDAPRRVATERELRDMQAIVREAMLAGAVGFATSTSPSHNGATGAPMPSRLADEAEMRALVRVLGDVGRGVFMLTKGGDTTIAFLESLAAETSRPVMIAALLHNSTNPDSVFRDLRDIGAARERGRSLFGQVSCCPLSMEFSMRAPYPLEGIRAWEPAMLAEGDDVIPILRDPTFRARIKAELEQSATVRLFNAEWDKLHVVEVKRDVHHALEGRKVDDIAREAGCHPLDWMLDFALDENLDTVFVAELLNSDRSAVAKLLNDPSSSIALSDAGAHLTFFCDAGFGLRLLGFWVREQGIMSLEEGVRRLTSQPAEIYGIRDRGRLVPGARADMMLFDPDSVDRGPTRRVHDLPAGEPRLTTDGKGVHGVWVNGVRIVGERGEVIDNGRPGQLIRDFA